MPQNINTTFNCIQTRNAKAHDDEADDDDDDDDEDSEDDENDAVKCISFCSCRL
jgi:hypothetical protein